MLRRNLFLAKVLFILCILLTKDAVGPASSRSPKLQSIHGTSSKELKEPGAPTNTQQEIEPTKQVKAAILKARADELCNHPDPVLREMIECEHKPGKPDEVLTAIGRFGGVVVAKLKVQEKPDAHAGAAKNLVEVRRVMLGEYTQHGRPIPQELKVVFKVPVWTPKTMGWARDAEQYNALILEALKLGPSVYVMTKGHTNLFPRDIIYDRVDGDNLRNIYSKVVSSYNENPNPASRDEAVMKIWNIHHESLKSMRDLHEKGYEFCDAKPDNLMLAKSPIHECKKLPTNLKGRSKMMEAEDPDEHCYIFESTKISFVDSSHMHKRQLHRNTYPCGRQKGVYIDVYTITLDWEEILLKKVKIVEPKDGAPLHVHLLWEMKKIFTDVLENTYYRVEDIYVNAMIRKLEKIVEVFTPPE